MEPSDVMAMLAAERTRLKGREWVIAHEFELLTIWQAARTYVSGGTRIRSYDFNRLLDAVTQIDFKGKST